MLPVVLILPGAVINPLALKSHRLGPALPPFCPTAILTIFDPGEGLAYTAAILLEPTLPISSIHTDDTPALVPDDNDNNGRSLVGCINAASKIPNTLVLPAITRLPGNVRLPSVPNVQLSPPVCRVIVSVTLFNIVSPASVKLPPDTLPVVDIVLVPKALNNDSTFELHLILLDLQQKWKHPPRNQLAIY